MSLACPGRTQGSSTIQTEYICLFHRFISFSPATPASAAARADRDQCNGRRVFQHHTYLLHTRPAPKRKSMSSANGVVWCLLKHVNAMHSCRNLLRDAIDGRDSLGVIDKRARRAFVKRNYKYNRFASSGGPAIRRKTVRVLWVPIRGCDCYVSFWKTRVARRRRNR